MTRIWSSQLRLATLTLSMLVCESLRQCGNSTTFCPDAGICCPAHYSPTTFGCRLGTSWPSDVHLPHDDESSPSWPPSPTSSCCMPGPPLAPSASLPNALVIGDSVSIGYTGTAAKIAADKVMIQHGPYDRSNGGAGSTSVGVACLDNWLVTQNQTKVNWDVILFNFGLHDLDNSSAAEALYKQQLTNITERIVATGTKKLIYALTTPFMPLTTVGNPVVHDLNHIAREVVAPHNITVLDLHKLVTDHCGTNYTVCDWCRRTPCSYHYNDLGESAQAHAVAAAIMAML